MKSNYDVIVIGGGAIGQAAAYHLAQQKAQTMVLEQFTFLNQLGSSAGVSRQFRIPYPDDYMVQMVLNSEPFWDQLQHRTHRPLLDKVGTLWFGDPNVHSTEGNITDAEKAMKKLEVPYTQLTVKEIEDQYHFRDLPSKYIGIYQAGGASIDFRATIQTLLEVNRLDPCVDLLEECPVIKITPQGTGFEVTTTKGVFSTGKLVLAPGPFVNDVTSQLGFGVSATYWNMASAYFQKTMPDINYPTWFVFQNADGDNGNQFYGFPEVIWDNPGYIRVAPDFVIEPLTDPKQRTLVPNEQELAYTSNWVRDHMTGLDPTPHLTSTCLVSLSNIPNKEMLIDFAPGYVTNHNNVVLYATGWAAKFTPYLGKILSDLALTGHTDFDLTPFQLGYKYFRAL